MTPTVSSNTASKKHKPELVFVEEDSPTALLKISDKVCGGSLMNVLAKEHYAAEMLDQLIEIAEKRLVHNGLVITYTRGEVQVWREGTWRAHQNHKQIHMRVLREAPDSAFQNLSEKV